jgi:putative inorganic carbon (HCO3(-)) transporter
MEFKKNNLCWLYLTGIFLILTLPLLNLPPWFSPPDWGKTIVFRIILSILIFVFLWQILSRRQISIKTSLPFWLLIALFGIYLLATIFSLDPYFSFFGNPYRSGGFLNFAFYILFAILAFLIIRQDDWQKIWDFSILIGALVSLIAIFQWRGLFKTIIITYENRPPSTIGGPIFLAIYLLLLFFLTLGFGIKERDIFKKIFYFLSLFLFFFAIFLTYTRAAYLGLAIGFFYFLFFYPKKLIFLKISVLILLILSILGIFYLNTETKLPKFIQENKLLQGVISRFSIKTALKDPRISGWKISWRALKDRPLLGYGLENFSIGFDRYFDPSLPNVERSTGYMVSWWDRAHNFIFDIALTAGIPALIIYVALFGILIWELQKLKKKKPQNSLLYHSIQATFLAYLVANFFSFDTFSTYLLSFLLIGFSLFLISENAQEKVFYLNIKAKNFIIFFLFLALIYFIWSFNLKPLKINAEINNASNFVRNENCAEAISKMEKILSQKSFLDAYLRLEYIGLLIKCKEQMPEASLELVKKSVTLMRETIKIQPYHTSNYIVLGSLINFWIEQETNPEIAQNLKTEANSYFEMAHKLSPKRQEVFIEWIKNDLITGEYQKAKEKAQKCIDLNLQLSDCWWLKGLSNIYLNEFEEAKENIETAGKRGYPIRSEDSLLKLAKVYVETKNYQKLLEIYQELIEIKPANPEYHASLAIVYREIGDFENARKEIKKALELAPELREEVEEFLRSLTP